MSPEIIIAISSSIIAICALLVSFWQGYVQVKHHKLSVKPHLAIDFDNRSSKDVAIYFRSNGLGPAKLTGYTWIVNGKRFPISSKQDYIDLLNVLGLGGVNMEFYAPNIGGIIESGFSIFLLQFPATAGTQEHSEIANRAFNATIELTYESMYGESFSDTHDPKYA